MEFQKQFADRFVRPREPVAADRPDAANRNDDQENPGA
jgi:hypothetical protein